MGAWVVVRRWVHTMQVESVYITAEGVSKVRYVPLDQVVVNKAVGLALLGLAVIVALVPFGDQQMSADLVHRLVTLAQEVAG